MMTLLSKQLNTEKARSLVHLYESGFNIPNTLIFNTLERNDLEAIQMYLFYEKNETFYLRLCFSDNTYPHYFGQLSQKDKIIFFIQELIDVSIKQNILDFDFIIQPLIPLCISGAIISKNNYLLVETVVGVPLMLFRNGIVNSRFIFYNNELISTEFYNQKESILWNVSSMEWSTISNSEVVLEGAVQFVNTHHYENNALYEFGIDDTNTFYIFERKKLPKNAYYSLDKSSDDSSRFIVSPTLSSNNKKDRYMEFPNFSLLSTCNKPLRYIFKSGAYTSHLASYLALNEIACEFLKSSCG